MKRFLFSAKPVLQSRRDMQDHSGGDFVNLQPSLYSSVDGSIETSLTEKSSTLAQFVPYQLNSTNAETLSSLFPSSLPALRPSSEQHSLDDVSFDSRSALGLHSLHVRELLSTGEKTSEQLPYVLRGSGSAYDSVMKTPYASESTLRKIKTASQGRRSKPNKKLLGHIPRQSSTAHTSRGHPSSSSRPYTTSGSIASGSGLGGARALSQGGLPTRDISSSLFSATTRKDWSTAQDVNRLTSYNPSATFADMTIPLSRLDPLCLNLSIGLCGESTDSLDQGLGGRGGSVSLFADGHHSVEEDAYGGNKPREDSWVSFAQGTMFGYDSSQTHFSNESRGNGDSKQFSREWKGQVLSHSAVFNTAPKMTSEHLIDTAFIKQLFVDGTTMEEAQNLIFKMQGVFELFDKECTGVIDWDTFTKLVISLIPERILRADAVQFIAAQAEDPTNSIDYREFCMSGKVTVIEFNESEESKKSLSVNGWTHRQQAVTGDASTYSWKNHVEWYRDRKSQSLIWLMRRASRAVMSFSRHLLAVEYLMYQGERGRCLGFLMECGDRALAGGDVCIQTAEKLKLKAKEARKVIIVRQEVQKVLVKIGEAAIKAIEVQYERMKRKKRRRGIGGGQMMADTIQTVEGKKQDELSLQRTFRSFMLGDGTDLGYSSDEEEKLAAEKLKEEMLKLALAKRNANPHKGYGRVQQRYYRTKLATEFLLNKGKQAVRLGYNKEDAVEWLTALGQRSTGQTKVSDSVFRYLVMKGHEAIKRSSISDDTFLSLCKKTDRAKNIYNKYLLAQEKLHRFAILALRTEKDVADLINTGQKWLMVCNNREYAYEYLKCRRNRAEQLVSRQRQAIEFLHDIPRRIWANDARVAEAEGFLKNLGRKAVAAEIVCDNVVPELTVIAQKGIRALKNFRVTWAYLQESGERARRQHFEKNWTVQSYNKPLLKEEEARIVERDKDTTVIRRGWTKDERLRAKLEDAFEYLALKPQSIQRRGPDRGIGVLRGQDLDDNENSSMVSQIASFQISKLSFSVLTKKGKLLGTGKNEFDPSSEFDKIDAEKCGYASFEEVWSWFQIRLNSCDQNASTSAGLFGGKKKAAGDFCLNDILTVRERAILTLFEKYEGRNSRR